MTTSTHPGAVPTSPSAFSSLPPTAPWCPARRLRIPRDPLALAAAFGVLALGVALVGLLVDHQVITGAPAWLKPAKFAISVTLYVVTLRWMIGLITGHRRLVGVVAVVSAVALVAELVLIDMQVVRGTTSHFNVASPFDGAVYGAMGVLISGVFLAAAGTGVLALRQRGLDAGLAAGIRWGLAVSLLGMAEAGTMIANTRWDAGGGHTVGAPDGGPGLPLTEWSSLHGDLRIAHFVGLHALQVLPLIAWALARYTRLDAHARAGVVRVAAFAQAGLVVLLTTQALRGQALLHPDAATVGEVVVLLALTLVVVVLNVSGRLRLGMRSRGWAPKTLSGER